MSANIPQGPPFPSATAPRLGYIGALDSLRALAVLAVLFYHADVLWLPGGFLGVEVFFVVSGYLITALLLAEYRSHGSINLIQFWQRRARRLLPALFAMLIAVMAYAVIYLPDEVASLRGDVAAAFTYVTNWYLIAANQSYFEIIGRPSLLRHLWSLAVEEQFYLLWPLLFAFVLIRLRTRAAMLLLLLGATLSALWMGLQFQPDTDPSRIYYGTDTRAAGLLIGAALAFAWTPRGGDSPSRLKRWLLDAVGLAALGGLVAAGLALSEFDAFLYQGGMLLVGVATAFLIAAVVSPHSPVFGGILSFRILRWIGQRSYSLYLWHWPVFMVTRPQLDTTLEGMPLLALRFALTFALAEISFRVVESPIRNGALGKAWENWGAAQGARRWGLGFAWMGILAGLALGTFLLGSAVIQAQPAAEPDYVLNAEEDPAFLNEQDSTATEIILPPETAGTDSVASVESSEMSSVSLILPEELPAEMPIDVPSAPDPQLYQDSWVRIARANHVPLINSLQSEINALRSARIDSGPRAPRIQPVCGDKCLARLEFLQLKEGAIRPAKTPMRQIARKVTPTPAKPTTPATTAAIPVTPPEEAQVLAVGDSVMLGASNYLRKSIFAIDVDAKIGRQVSAALKLLRERQDARLIPHVVIVHLGNNGTFSPKQFDEMMTVLRDVPRVVFLTNKVPRKWQDPNNNALAEGVGRYPNALLVDWNGTSALHPEWFWKDGIHLRPEGARVYANLIARIVDQQIQ